MPSVYPDAGRLREYSRLIRLDRPIGIWLLLAPALWALWFAADGMPDPRILAVFVAGVVLMRSAGCAINDWADRDFDARVERTKDRPLAAGRITPREALGVFMVLAGLAFALVLTLDALTIVLALPALALAVSYPFAKRYTHLPQFHLGAAFGFAVPMAFAAATANIPALAWVLFAATLSWAVAYDTLYAMADRPDDRRAGVKSTAILFGRYDLFWIGVFQIATLILLGVAGRMDGRGVWYAAGLVLSAASFVHQLWQARHRDPAACLRAFRANQWVGWSVFAGLAVDYAVG